MDVEVIDNNQSENDSCFTSVSQRPVNPLSFVVNSTNNLQSLVLPTTKMIGDDRFWVDTDMTFISDPDAPPSSCNFYTDCPGKSQYPIIIGNWSPKLVNNRLHIDGLFDDYTPTDKSYKTVRKEWIVKHRISSFIFRDINQNMCSLSRSIVNCSSIPQFVQNKFANGIPDDWQSFCYVWQKSLLSKSPNDYTNDSNQSSTINNSSLKSMKRQSELVALLKRKLARTQQLLKLTLLRESLVSDSESDNKRMESNRLALSRSYRDKNKTNTDTNSINTNNFILHSNNVEVISFCNNNKSLLNINSRNSNNSNNNNTTNTNGIVNIELNDSESVFIKNNREINREQTSQQDKNVSNAIGIKSTESARRSSAPKQMLAKKIKELSDCEDSILSNCSFTISERGRTRCQTLPYWKGARLDVADHRISIRNQTMNECNSNILETKNQLNGTKEKRNITETKISMSKQIEISTSSKHGNEQRNSSSTISKERSKSSVNETSVIFSPENLDDLGSKKEKNNEIENIMKDVNSSSKLNNGEMCGGNKLLQTSRKLIFDSEESELKMKKDKNKSKEQIKLNEEKLITNSEDRLDISKRNKNDKNFDTVSTSMKLVINSEVSEKKMKKTDKQLKIVTKISSILEESFNSSQNKYELNQQKNNVSSYNLRSRKSEQSNISLQNTSEPREKKTETRKKRSLKSTPKNIEINNQSELTFQSKYEDVLQLRKMPLKSNTKKQINSTKKQNESLELMDNVQQPRTSNNCSRVQKVVKRLNTTKQERKKKERKQSKIFNNFNNNKMNLTELVSNETGSNITIGLNCTVQGFGDLSVSHRGRIRMPSLPFWTGCRLNVKQNETTLETVVPFASNSKHLSVTQESKQTPNPKQFKSDPTKQTIDTKNSKTLNKTKNDSVAPKSKSKNNAEQYSILSECYVLLKRIDLIQHYNNKRQNNQLNIMNEAAKPTNAKQKRRRTKASRKLPTKPLELASESKTKPKPKKSSDLNATAVPAPKQSSDDSGKSSRKRKLFYQQDVLCIPEEDESKKPTFTIRLNSYDFTVDNKFDDDISEAGAFATRSQ